MRLKATFLFLALMCCVNLQCAVAQSGLLNQKSAQRAYCLQQIALYKILNQLNHNGYAASRFGINNTTAIGKTELTLHKRYFNDLQQVPSSIKRLPQIRQVLSYASATRNIAGAISVQDLPAGTAAVLTQFAAKLVCETDHNLDCLELAVVNGNAQMTHNERIDRLNKCLKIAVTCFSAARMLRDFARMTKDQVRRSKIQTQITRKLYATP